MNNVLFTIFCIGGYLLAVWICVVWAAYCDKLNNDWAEFCKKQSDGWTLFCQAVIKAAQEREEQIEKDNL